MPEAEPFQWAGQNAVRWRGRRLLYFSGCDYFRLSRDPRVAAALRSTLAQHGLNVSASRLTTGNHELYGRLETRVAKFFGAEAATLVPNGYLAPMAILQTLAPEFTHALMDERTHGSLRDAARMLSRPVKLFKHRDPSDLARLLAKLGKTARPLVLTDGMFYDGSAAPLSAYLKILPARGMIIVDDAHGGGVLGTHGRGTLEHEKVRRRRIIQCLALSKAFGVYGGMVLSSAAIRRKIMAGSRIFKGGTPLPLPLAGAALAAVAILSREPVRRRRLFENARRFRTALRAAGWLIPDQPGPIVLLPPLTATATERLKKRLLAAGIYPPYLKYSNVMMGVFRFVISSEHTPAQMDRVARVLKDFKEAS